VVTGEEVASALARVLRATEQAQAELDSLDAVAGDGDHGVTMVLGWRAAVAALAQPPAGAGAALRVAAEAFASVGGTAGPLWGTALLRAGRTLDQTESIAAAAEAAVAGMCDRGRCLEGERTVVDAMAPAARTLASGGDFSAAAAAAAAAANATANLEPRHGRAALAPERVRGHVDPGSRAAAVFWQALASKDST
jgi:phosphoenolpyruvate---glycerone phosphotransferase subunit DhaL